MRSGEGRLDHLADRLETFARQGVVSRRVATRVLSDIAPDLTIEQLAVLLPTRIHVDETDGSITLVAAGGQDGVEPQDTQDLTAALRAAREVLADDRHRRRPSKRLLTALEEVGLATIVRGGATQPLDPGAFALLTGERRAAAESLFVHNIRLVWSNAAGYVGYGLELDDLAQSGMIGLVRAVEMFDPGRGFKFSTYATNWIRQSITRAIANESRLVRIPVHMHEVVMKVARERDSHYLANGVWPTVEQLCSRLNMGERQVLEAIRLVRPMVYLDQPVAGEVATTLGDLVLREGDEGRPEWDPAEVHAVVEELPATLSDREAAVLRLRFGLVDGRARTLEEIGGDFGVTRERIRQIEKRAMESLASTTEGQHEEMLGRVTN
jgi:RNA polymerase primary sigma factor